MVTTMTDDSRTAHMVVVVTMTDDQNMMVAMANCEDDADDGDHDDS